MRLVRPFQPGDEAALWFGGLVVQGRVLVVYTMDSNGQQYAIVSLGNRRYRHFPLWQIVPIGATRFKPHHVWFWLKNDFKQMILNLLGPKKPLP